MIIQISVAVIAIALVTLVGFLISAILKFRKAISLIQADLHHYKTIPQLIEWVATSVILAKKSKEFIKKYVK